MLQIANNLKIEAEARLRKTRSITEYLDKNNPPIAAWDLICRPENKGGLGIINQHTHNIFLLLKMLHKFVNFAGVAGVPLV